MSGKNVLSTLSSSGSSTGIEDERVAVPAREKKTKKWEEDGEVTNNKQRTTSHHIFEETSSSY
jgi:hypothetical protein